MLDHVVDSSYLDPGKLASVGDLPQRRSTLAPHTWDRYPVGRAVKRPKRILIVDVPIEARKRPPCALRRLLDVPPQICRRGPARAAAFPPGRDAVRSMRWRHGGRSRTPRVNVLYGGCGKAVFGPDPRDRPSPSSADDAGALPAR